METTNYEKIGKKLGRMEQETMFEILFDKANLSKYRKHYESLPLFLVGWKQADMDNEIDRELEPLELDLIQLRYPDMLLDFPLTKMHGGVTAPIVRIKEFNSHGPVWYCEVLYPIADTMDFIPSDLRETAEIYCENMILSLRFLLVIDKERKEFTTILSADCWDYSQKAEWIVDPMFLPFYFSDNNSENSKALADYWGHLIIKTILYINCPQNVIVLDTPELTPHEQRFKEKGKKPFFQKKPRHIIFNHEQFKVLYLNHNHLGRGKGTKKSPHMRVAYPVWLRSPRFKNKINQLSWRKAAAVNNLDRKWEHNKRIYEIIGAVA